MTGGRLVCLYPWLAMGGADKFNLDMLSGLAARGWRPTLVTTLPGQHPWRAAFEPFSDDIIDLTAWPPEQYPARLLQIIGSRAAGMVLISNSSTGYHLLPYLRAHFPHITFVDYNHMEEPDWRDGNYPRLSLTFAHALDLQIVSSQHLKEWMCERGGQAERIAVCTTNIDPEDWDPQRYDRAALRQALALPPDAPVVLYAARLERQKQPILAVQVMRRVAAQSPEVVFLVAGDGLFAPYVRGALRRHGLNRRVRMLGAVSNHRMRELLALSDILFLPSRMEGISLALYEAMAMGVVPVSAAIGGQPELVTPECGVLIAPGAGEQAAYVAALLQLLRNPERRRQMGGAARERVGTHFRLAQMHARMHNLLALARHLHDTRPRPPVTAHAALAAARYAVAAARHDEAGVRRDIGADDTPRQRVRKLYWRLVERGAWRIVPLMEQIRAQVVRGAALTPQPSLARAGEGVARQRRG